MKAFPSIHDPKTGTMQLGMELRDYFAAKAMQASLTNNVHLIDEDQYNSLGKLSYKVADALMKAREE